jgi:hypothetical protein
MVDVITKLFLALASYGVIGCLFAVGFHWRGLSRLDPAAQGAGIGFRTLITPGVIALWPLLAIRWWQAERGRSARTDGEVGASARRLRSAHGLAWKILVATIPLLVGAALWLRPSPAADPRGSARWLNSGSIPTLNPSR